MADVKIITESQVFVLGRPAVDRDAVGRLLSATGYDGRPLDYAPSDAENLIEIGGRVCYRSFGRGRPHDDYVRHIIEVGHGSVTEHAVWTLAVIGISRTCSHEVVRHRFLSPSQESQRYVDASDVAFVVPPALLGAHRETEAENEREREASDWLNTPEGRRAWAESPKVMSPCPPTPPHHKAYFAWWEAIGFARDQYARMAESLAAMGLPLKQAREAARSVLPGCVETRVVLTANARAWRNFLELRCSAAADAEIRRLANRVYEALVAEAPVLFGDYTGQPLPDGTHELRTPNRKV